MRIGIMLRHADQHGGGVMVYTRNLLDHLLSLPGGHEFVLLYHHGNHLDDYRHLPNVSATAMAMPTRLLWDQLAARSLARRHGLDLIFNPKYSLPLYSHIPGVFVCHGLDWYVMPWGSKWTDRLSHRFLMPRYAKQAAGIIAVSDTTRSHVLEFWDVAPEKVRTIYHGVADHFLRPVAPALIDEVRRHFRLPTRFVLFVGQIYPPKNFERLLTAYARVGPARGIHLVVAGGHVQRSAAAHLALIETLGIREWVISAGWIEHEKLPAFYSLAEALVMPSLYEACPSPPIEAMATGCPVVTANRYGTRDVVQDAAVLVDPESTDSIAEGIERILSDDVLREQLIARGRERAKFFAWDRCARETLDFLEQVNNSMN